MKLIFPLLVLALCGCATEPVRVADAVAVPGDRILDASFLQPAAGAGQVTVTRDSGLLAARCTVRLSADWKPIADLRPGETVTIHLPEGDHILAVKCGYLTGDVRAPVRAGARSTYRVGVDGDWAMFIAPH